VIDDEHVRAPVGESLEADIGPLFLEPVAQGSAPVCTVDDFGGVAE
jgi:hypothetical protein